MMSIQQPKGNGKNKVIKQSGGAGSTFSALLLAYYMGTFVHPVLSLVLRKIKQVLMTHYLTLKVPLF